MRTISHQALARHCLRHVKFGVLRTAKGSGGQVSLLFGLQHPRDHHRVVVRVQVWGCKQHQLS